MMNPEMRNPEIYSREVRYEEETTEEAAARYPHCKSEHRLSHEKGSFTYTVERLQSGCLLYQLALIKQN